MPANLPPEYYSAEDRLKKAQTPQEKIFALEDLIASVPKHKGTDKLRADLRRKLSQFREDAIKRKKSGGKGDLFTVERHGAAQIALAGLPNSGKSSIVAALTNARPFIADYPVSTVMPLSGMMPFEDILFQMVDLPPIGNDSTDGWVSGILRGADMLLLVVDLADAPEIQAGMLLDQLRRWRIRIAGDLENDPEETGHQKPKRIVIAANKSDLSTAEGACETVKRAMAGSFGTHCISTVSKEGIEGLRRSLFEYSDIIRVYTKEPGKDADLCTPFTVARGTTVIELAGIIHRDFVAQYRYACVWGSSRYEGQKVQKDYSLRDRDVVEYHVK